MQPDNTPKVPTPKQLEAFRYVAEWAWLNRIVPPEIHDAAAFALDQASLAHGFYSPAGGITETDNKD